MIANVLGLFIASISLLFILYTVREHFRLKRYIQYQEAEMERLLRPTNPPIPLVDINYELRNGEDMRNRAPRRPIVIKEEPKQEETTTTRRIRIR
jgi:hypothetical protein